MAQLCETEVSDRHLGLYRTVRHMFQVTAPSPSRETEIVPPGISLRMGPIYVLLNVTVMQEKMRRMLVFPAQSVGPTT